MYPCASYAIADYTPMITAPIFAVMHPGPSVDDEDGN